MNMIITGVLASLFLLCGVIPVAVAANEKVAPKLIVIAANNFDGEIAIAMANSVKHRAGWTLQVNRIEGEHPSASKTGERASFPLFLVFNGNGDIIVTHVGLINAQGVLEAAATQLSP